MENRLFLAVGFTEAERAALRRAAEPLRQRLTGRFVDASLYHVTLHFFGAVSPDRVAAIQQAMAQAAAIAAPFAMTSGPAGSFGRADSAVLWLGIDAGAQQLRALYAALAKELIVAGFAPEDKPLRSHITLARDADTRGAGPLSAMPVDKVELRADALTLFNSTRREGRLVYEPVHVERLRG